jgi:DNA-binding beta-propeller fold protein YncE
VGRALLLFALVAALIPAAILTSACGSCSVSIRQTSIVPIAGQTGNYDGVEIDNHAHRLYVADRTDSGVDVFDTSRASPAYIGTIFLGALPNGLALAPDFNKLYVGLSNGTVADVNTDPQSPTYYKVVGRIAIQATSADLLDYSPQRQRVYVGAGTFVAAINPNDDSVPGHFVVGAPVEQPRYDPADGFVYVTSPGLDTLFQIDPTTGAIRQTYTLGGCKPSGLAINAITQMALLACRQGVMRLDLPTAAFGVIHDVAGGDIVSFDPTTQTFLVASPKLNPRSVVGVFDGDGNLVNAITTDGESHAAAYDSTHGLVYAPDARTNKGQLLSFSPTACAPPSEWTKFFGGFSLWLIPLAAAALFLWWYARRVPRPRVVRAG